MDIKIGKPARVCNATDRAFEHGEQVISLVRMHEGQFIREDYSEEAWDAARGEGAIAVWTTTYIDPKVAEQEPPEVFSPLRQLFYEAVEGKERKTLAKAYLAAELLRRQKVFRLLKQSDDAEEDVRVALYNDRIGNRLVEVRDPNLTLNDMEEGRTALIQRLQELEAPPEEAEESPDETADESSEDFEEDSVEEAPQDAAEEDVAHAES